MSTTQIPSAAVPAQIAEVTGSTLAADLFAMFAGTHRPDAQANSDEAEQLKKGRAA